MTGPVTYDLISLLRDCYVRWPAPRVRQWVLAFADRLRRMGLLEGVGDDLFWQWFNAMGAQRHLKVCGIFARLNYRDGKTGYSVDAVLSDRRMRSAGGQWTCVRAELCALVKDPHCARAVGKAA